MYFFAKQTDICNRQTAFVQYRAVTHRSDMPSSAIDSTQNAYIGLVYAGRLPTSFLLCSSACLHFIQSLACAACLLDPSYCDILMPSEMSSLLHAANMLIIKLQRRMLEMAKMNRQLHVLRVLQLQSASNFCEVKWLQLPVPVNR